MTARLTAEDLAEIARLYEIATTPLDDPDAGQDTRVEYSLARIRAEVKLEEVDAIGRLLAELSATRRERDEAYRTADQLREGVRGLEAENRRLRPELDERNAEVDALMDRLAETAPSDRHVAERAIVIRRHGNSATVTLECTPDNFIVIWRALPLAEAELCADSARNILGHVLADYVAQLRAEQSADRAAVKALVEALPRCETLAGPCSELATLVLAGEASVLCEQHRLGWARDLPYGAPLRALQARMATWGEAKAETHEEALARHDASDHACDVTFIRQALEAGSDAAEAIHWPEFFLRRKRLGAAAESIEAPVRATVEWMMQECGWEEVE